MRVTKVDVSVEKLLLTGMITSDTFLKKVLPLFDYDYLDLSPVKIVAKWVLDYYQKYEKAPKAHIQDMFRDKEERLGEDDSKWIADFLSSLSGDYEKKGINEEYLFDQVVRYFKRQKLEKSAKRVLDALDAGKDDRAEQVWMDSMIMPAVDDLGIDPFDPATIKGLWKKQDIRATMTLGIPSLDRMTGPSKSGWLVVFMGPMKRGKTWALVHVAARALTKGLNVVFISLESEDFDNAMRFWMNVGTLASDEDTITIPRFVNKDKDDIVIQKEYEMPRATRKNVLDMVKKFSRAAGAARLRVKGFPMGYGGIEEIKNYLNLLEIYEGFWPHVIVVDYIGNMKRPKGVKEEDKWDTNSMNLKALGQERKVIMYSGHQGTREALEILTMSPIHASRDIRVLANVDVLYGLNQTDQEMKRNVMRWNVLEHRHHKFTRLMQAKVLQQFEIGQVVLDSMLIEAPKGKQRKGKDDLKGEEK